MFSAESKTIREYTLQPILETLDMSRYDKNGSETILLKLNATTIQ